MVREFAVALGMGARQYLRNPLFLILIVGLPPTFITLAFVATPDVPFILNIAEAGAAVVTTVGMINLHGAVMVPMTVAFLAGILGMFVMLSARQGDHRLVIAGYSPNLLLVVRLIIIAGMSLVITAISVGVTLISFQPEQLGIFFFVNLISALQYGFLGAIVGTFLSAMGGTYLIFFAPMIDVGLVQNPMFIRESADLWVKFLPGYAPMEVLVDVSFSAQLDTVNYLLVSVVYLAVIAIVAGYLFHRVVAVRH